VAAPSIARDFRSAFERLLKKGKDPTPVMKVINRIQLRSELTACLDIYCALFTPDMKLATRGQFEYARSTGYALFLRATQIATDTNGLAQVVLMLPLLSNLPESADRPAIVYAKRWALLDERDQQLLALYASKAVADQQTPKTVERSLMSVLRQAYFDKHREPPERLDQLLGFSFADGPGKTKFMALAEACAVPWRFRRPYAKISVKDALAALDAAFDALEKYLDETIREPIDLLRIMAWARESPTISEEIYLEAVQRGQELGITRWKITGMLKAKTFVGEDAEFVYAPLKDPARDLLRYRLAAAFKDRKAFRAAHRARRRATVNGNLKGIQILDELELLDRAKIIKADWTSRPLDAANRFTMHHDTRAVWNQKYWMHQSVLDMFTVIWIEPGPYPWLRRALIEVHGLPGFAFFASPGDLSELNQEAFYRELARNANALAAFMLAYLQALGYIFDAMTAGMSGGIRHIIFEFATELLIEKATDTALDVAGIENPWIKAAVGFGVNFVPRPKAGAAKVRTPEEIDADLALARSRGVDESSRGARRPQSGEAAKDRTPHAARQSSSENVIFLSPDRVDPDKAARSRDLFKDPVDSPIDEAMTKVKQLTERIFGDGGELPGGAGLSLAAAGGGRIPFAERAAIPGPMARIREGAAGGSGTGGGTGGGAGKAASKRSEASAEAKAKLEASELFRRVASYDRFLDAGQKETHQRARTEILQELRAADARAYAKARSRLTGLLTKAREWTGEYRASGLVFSSFDVARVVSVPTRRNGVSVLDQVYEIRNSEKKFLLAEVKGGEDTALGWTNKQTYAFEDGELRITSLRGEKDVRQASGEWLYQRFAEIYRMGGKQNRKLAQDLFKAAMRGEVGTVVIKSGDKADVFVKDNTADVVDWFTKKMEWDHSNGFPIPK
jgi:hypothetical protein